MNGVSEAMVRAMMKDRVQSAMVDHSEAAEWCRMECNPGRRSHG